MRIRFKPWARGELEASKFYIDNPEDYKEKWRELFANDKPLHIELGCGKGGFISQIAVYNPDINYIAIDLVDAMLGLAKRKVEEEYKMANREIDNILVRDLMIPSEKVAHVQLNNPLEHALLVLIRSGYFAVPVLDTSFKLAGSISKTVILDQILGVETYEMERLSELKVHEVMDELVSIHQEESFINGLKAVIDSPFVCVVDDDGYFVGILTRRAILKTLKKDYYQKRNQH